MATFCSNCGGVPEFHVAGNCWCEDFCTCSGYVEGGMTIPNDDPSQQGAFTAKCRHCGIPMPKADWKYENYCVNCLANSGDISAMVPGTVVTVDFSGQPFGGFHDGEDCAICKPFYMESAIDHICYEDGGCVFCRRGIPRRLPMVSYMERWKCNDCKHPRMKHGKVCLDCVRLHRKRCYSWKVRQPAKVPTFIINTTIERIKALRKMPITAIRPALPE